MRSPSPKFDTASIVWECPYGSTRRHGHNAILASLMQRFVAIIVWLGSTALLAPLCFFAVMALAGPHGGILQEFLHQHVLLAAWALLVL